MKEENNKKTMTMTAAATTQLFSLKTGSTQDLTYETSYTSIKLSCIMKDLNSSHIILYEADEARANELPSFLPVPDLGTGPQVPLGSP